MKYLLDANACIDLLRPGRGRAVRARIEQAGPENVAICSVVRMELVFGALRSAKRDENLNHVQTLLAGLDLASFRRCSGGPCRSPPGCPGRRGHPDRRQRPADRRHSHRPGPDRDHPQHFRVPARSRPGTGRLEPRVTATPLPTPRPVIGYDKAAALAKQAFKEGKTVRQLAYETLVGQADTTGKRITREALDKYLDPWSMTVPGGGGECGRVTAAAPSINQTSPT